MKNTKLFLKKNHYYELFKNKNKSIRGYSKSRFSHSDSKKELFKNKFFKTTIKKNNEIIEDKKRYSNKNFCLYQNYKNYNHNKFMINFK